MKTVSQLPSGKKPIGTTSYMGRAEHLLQSRCNVQKGSILLIIKELLVSFFYLCNTGLVNFTVSKDSLCYINMHTVYTYWLAIPFEYLEEFNYTLLLLTIAISCS